MLKVKKVAIVSKNRNVVHFVRHSLAQDFQIFFASDCATLALLLKKFRGILVLADYDCDFISEENFTSDQIAKFVIFSTRKNRTNKSVLSFPNELSECIKENCIPKNVLAAENRISGQDEESPGRPESFDSLISRICGESQATKILKGKILTASSSDIPVLLTGESGSGKSLVAKIIHSFSPRKSYPFYYVNISGLSETLVESELFGNVKGAFTDAEFRKGCFESAENSTLFLDEIGDTSLNVQKKLLHVIENLEYRKVGSDEIKKTNVRLIFATNADLEQKVSDGEFRQDLYYRIKRLVIKVPPLRDRKDDIPKLCRMYLAEKYPDKSITEEGIKFLQSYDWPGNVRQMEACLDRAALFCPNSAITPDYLEF